MSSVGRCATLVRQVVCDSRARGSRAVEDVPSTAKVADEHRSRLAHKRGSVAPQRLNHLTGKLKAKPVTEPAWQVAGAEEPPALVGRVLIEGCDGYRPMFGAGLPLGVERDSSGALVLEHLRQPLRHEPLRQR
jgi:hypothetical protein